MGIKIGIISGVASLAFTLAACATATSIAADAPNKRTTTAELADRLRPNVRVYRPQGAGPFPAVLQVHGCGGAKKIMDDYGQAAADAGILAVIIDSFDHRNIGYERATGRVCKGYQLRGRERSGDVVAGLEIMRDLPDVDPDRLALAGWSHGGWTIMDLLAMRLPKERPPYLTDVPDDVFAGVRGIFLIYPYSGFPALTRGRGWHTTDIPAHVLIVENDSMANPKDIENAIAKAQASGAEITSETWPGLTHAFEEDDHLPGSGLRYDAEGAARARDLYVSWLTDKLGVTPRRTEADAEVAADETAERATE